jgi:hypothetical protein
MAGATTFVDLPGCAAWATSDRPCRTPKIAIVDPSP